MKIELKFDKRGHLLPYGKNQISFDDFRNYFIESFDKGSSRLRYSIITQII